MSFGVGEACLLEGEVPFGGLVGVVDEHEGGTETEALGLLDHGLLVLADEACAKELCDGGDEGDAVEDIPGGGDVDAAGGGGDGGDGGEGGEPLFAGADGFEAAVGEDEVDGGGDGLAVDAEEFIGGGVGGGCVGGHSEALGDGLEVLGFFVDAGG